jgi:4-nitrophenyl phosphatase
MQGALYGVRGIIFDMDGVLWRGETPIGDLPAIFARLAERGYQVALATNNATLTVGQFLDKLADFGVRLASWQVVSSPVATADYLKQRHPQGGPVFIVGEVGLQDTLKGEGFFQSEKNVLAVVAGLDRNLTYDKLKKAALLIRAGAPFIGTNPDNTPTPEVILARVLFWRLSDSHWHPPLIIGKPRQKMYRLPRRLGSHRLRLW